MMPVRCALSSVGDLDAVPQDVRQRKRPAGQPLGHRLAVEVLHDQVLDVILLSDVEEHADVRMVEAGDGPRLALEARPELHVSRDLRRQHLDGHITR